MTGIDMRDAAFDTIHEIAITHSEAMVLTNDMGSVAVERIKVDFPTRVINVGIAEQNLMSVAAGLALEGKTVFVYGITPHVTKRCFEQIYVDVCSMNLPVIILGVGSGLCYGPDGPTHHSTNDIAMMRSIPGLAIYNPSDAISMRALVRQSYGNQAPTYVRVDKDQSEPIYDSRCSFDDGLATVVDGNDVTIISSGLLVRRAIMVSNRLRKEGISARVVDLYRIKPCNYDLLISVLNESNVVVTLEEHSEIGGIGGLVAEQFASLSSRPSLRRYSLNDEFFFGSATKAWIHDRFGLTEDSLVKSIREYMAKGARLDR